MKNISELIERFKTVNFNLDFTELGDMLPEDLYAELGHPECIEVDINIYRDIWHEISTSVYKFDGYKGLLGMRYGTRTYCPSMMITDFIRTPEFYVMEEIQTTTYQIRAEEVSSTK